MCYDFYRAVLSLALLSIFQKCVSGEFLFFLAHEPINKIELIIDYVWLVYKKN